MGVMEKFKVKHEVIVFSFTVIFRRFWTAEATRNFVDA